MQANHQVREQPAPPIAFPGSLNLQRGQRIPQLVGSLARLRQAQPNCYSWATTLANSVLIPVATAPILAISATAIRAASNAYSIRSWPEIGRASCSDRL